MTTTISSSDATLLPMFLFRTLNDHCPSVPVLVSFVIDVFNSSLQQLARARSTEPITIEFGSRPIGIEQ
eukprot:11374694-Karenia_brevis.AAC.1